MGKLGRVKGSAFERKVAKIIATHFKVSNKECYRTPLSGGHPLSSDRGDLVLGPELRKLFKFCVECKHHKSWRWFHLFRPNKEMQNWGDQVLKSASECNLTPLLVFSGNGGIILAGTPDYNNIRKDEGPVCYLRLRNLTWAVQPLDQFLLSYKREKVK